VYNRLPLDFEALASEYLAYGDRLAPYIAETSGLLYAALRDGRRILLEGGQGTLLDLDHGTYPFVTSSNPVSGGALSGSGLGPKEVDRVVGVTKAYVTRVGAGPFPTEDVGEAGTHMGEKGVEFGTTTGRARRCGWFDAVLLRYAVRINGLTELFLTKLDVLSGLPEVLICSAYRAAGREYRDMPPHQSLFHKAEPVYERLAGWGEEVQGVRRFEDLPAAARSYVLRIGQLGGLPVHHLSVGPDREQTLEVRPLAVSKRRPA
jgi:adenylosuccinate synthase